MSIKFNSLVISFLILSLQITLSESQPSGPLNPVIPNLNCLTPNIKGTCSICSPGYYLNIGYCYPVNPFCAGYNMSNGACTSCGGNRILDSSLCININRTCADGSTSSCTNCSDGFIPLSGFCVQVSSFNIFCLNFTNNACVNCMQGYYLYNGGCTFANPLCATYAMNGGSCVTCFSGFVPAYGTCVSLVSLNPYCSTASGLICTKCNNGYFLNSKEICVFANTLCAIYGPNGECLTCSQGTLNSSLCLISTRCSNSGINGNCLSCFSGSTLWNSGCVSLTSLFPFCDVFNGKNCRTCKTGTYLFKGVCLVRNPFCATSSPTGNCTSCFNGNLFASPLCLVISPNCVTVNVNGGCLICHAQYQLYGSFCVSLASLYPYCSSFVNQTCTSCILGYYLNNELCVPSNPLCFTYDMSSGACVSCYSGFTLWGSACVDLTSLRQNCLNFSGISCIACKSGYVVTNGFCVSGNPSCSSYDIAGGCLNCTQGYITGAFCLVPSSCQDTDQYGNCIDCLEGSTIWGSDCVSVSSIVPFCSTFVNNTCTDCSYGYYLIGGGCALLNPFCATSDQRGFCLSCNQGYILSGTLCVVNDICKTVNSQTNVCTSCDWGYVLSGTRCISQSTINPFCLTFSAGICINCAIGYYLQNGSCVYPDSNCRTSNETTSTCLTCHTQYFLTNGVCLPISPLCNGSNLNGSCTNCFGGYSLIGGQCISLIIINPYCLSFNNSACVICQNKFYLDLNTICSPVNPLCDAYNMTTGFCTTCIAGYLMLDANCIAAAILNPNCISFNNTVCTYCKDRYYIGTNGNCTLVSSICSTYDMFTGNCIQCIQGYSMQNGNCLSKYTLNPQCNSFDSDTNCLNCSNGYFLGTNTFCTQVNILCGTYEMTSGICKTCINGYTLVSQTCFTTINNCASYTSVGQCQVCASGFILINQNCFTTIKNCANYTSVGQCQVCASGFTLVGQNCFTTVNNCTSYTYVGQCQLCSSGFILINQNCFTIINNCASYTSDGQCQLCSSRFTLVGQNCFTTINNCASYTSVGGCQVCASEFILTNHNCFTIINNCANYTSVGQCQACASGFTIVGQSCFTTISNCSFYTSVGQCQVCDSRFTLLGQSCFKIINNCANYTSVGQCQACASGFTLVGQSCFKIINNCSSYTSVGQCQLCASGLILINQNCFTIINDCATYSLSGQCSACITGYLLFSNGTCISAAVYNPNCLAFNRTVCTNCINGYFIGANGICSLVSVLCNTYSMSTGFCLSCVSGYVLVINGSCLTVASQNPNCLTFNNTICLRCRHMFYIGANGNCSAVGSCCTTYNMTTGACSGCLFGYILFNGGCAAPMATFNNPWCFVFDNSVCLSCNSRYYIGTNGICTAANPQCQTYNMSTGSCTSCFSGWAVWGTTCSQTSSANPYCTAFTGMTCTNCVDRFYLGVNNICTAVNQACYAYSVTTGLCLNCQPGWKLANGLCK